MTLPVFDDIEFHVCLLLYAGAFEVSRNCLRPRYRERTKVPIGINERSHVGNPCARAVGWAGVLQRECENLAISDAAPAVDPIQRGVSVLSDCGKCCHLLTPS